MKKESMATNDVFADLLVLLRIHKEKEYVLSLFQQKGWDVSKSKLKSWSVRTERDAREFRAMPLEALKDFIAALHEEKLIDNK